MAEVQADACVMDLSKEGYEVLQGPPKSIHRPRRDHVELAPCTSTAVAGSGSPARGVDQPLPLTSASTSRATKASVARGSSDLSMITVTATPAVGMYVGVENAEAFRL